MRAGDAFYLPDKSADGHLWVVISEPEKDAERVLIVSMTSFDVDKENACLIEAGEHPRVTHKTCICYRPARQASLAKLQLLQGAGVLRMQPPVSADLLRRIREGASLSRRIDFEHVQLLIEQGLLD